jgi:hypothetical protein
MPTTCLTQPKYFYLDCMSCNDHFYFTQPSSVEQCAAAFIGKPFEFGAAWYLERMFKYSRASPCCFAIAVIYLARFNARHPSLELTSRTIQRFLLVATMLATKFYEDNFFLNSTWCGCSFLNFFSQKPSKSKWVDPVLRRRAKIGDIPLTQLNSLELTFLLAIDFNLNVHPADYAAAAADLRAAATARRARILAPPPCHAAAAASPAPPAQQRRPLLCRSCEAERSDGPPPARPPAAMVGTGPWLARLTGPGRAGDPCRGGGSPAPRGPASPRGSMPRGLAAGAGAGRT